MCRNANHPIDQNCGKEGEAESETATIDSETPSRETFSPSSDGGVVQETGRRSGENIKASSAGN